jgi:hypothetical protein
MTVTRFVQLANKSSVETAPSLTGCVDPSAWDVETETFASKDHLLILHSTTKKKTFSQIVSMPLCEKLKTEDSLIQKP